MDNIKVVVDTNVFINGIFSGDEFSKAIFRLKALNKVVFVMNKEMQNELIVTFTKILMEAFKRNGNQGQEFKIIPLCTSLSRCLWQVREVDHIIYINHCKDDASDNKFIDYCIDDNVKFLITQDAHINSCAKELKSNYEIDVLSPFQFYTKYKMNML